MKTSSKARAPAQKERDASGQDALGDSPASSCAEPHASPLLIHAPDKQAMDIAALLHEHGLACATCTTMDEVEAGLHAGAAGCILTDDALAALGDRTRLIDWLRAQPAWSDVSLIVLMNQGASNGSEAALAVLRECAHLTVMDTASAAPYLAHAAYSAMRGCRRQNATRNRLNELTRSLDELVSRNAELEGRIVARTHELVEANNRLMKEIAGRERAQAALSQGQKLEAIGRLTGGIAHDFNNMLHVVKMNVELVNMYATDEKVKAVVERVKTAAKRGTHLTNQLLSFARSQSLVPQLTDLNKLLLGMRDLVEISAGSAVEVQMELGHPVHVLLDRGQLEMAVLNLAVNAKEAMPEGGTLKITTRTQECKGERDLPAGDYVALTIADTGTGIAAHLLPKVFDPFFTTKPLGQGTGLGLSQVYGFARQSGGFASIRSELGKGTTVELLFPLAHAEDREMLQEARQAPAVPPRAPTEHILVVDDDAEVRRVISECLSVIGYQVTEAANGGEGLAAIASCKPDLMVVDYVMPDMTGAEMISRARQRYGEVPVIVATGYADMAAVERLAGKPMILRKPFSMAVLGDAVRQTLEASHAAAAASSSA